MAAIGGKHTRPEMRVRRIVHGLGYRYTLHRKSLPGTPDLVFPSRRKVIFRKRLFLAPALMQARHVTADGKRAVLAP